MCDSYEGNGSWRRSLKPLRTFNWEKCLDIRVLSTLKTWIKYKEERKENSITLFDLTKFFDSTGLPE